MRYRLWGPAMMLALAAAPAFAQAPDVAVLASTCVTCHGPALEGAGAIPPLKGRPGPEIVQTLKAFQSGERPATIMGRLTKGWSTAEIEALGAALGGAK